MALTDLTRISTSGIATGSTIDSPILRKDVSLRGSQVGVTSVLFDSSENELNLKDNVKLTFGNATNGDLRIYHDTSNGSYVKEAGPGALRIQGDAGVWIQSSSNNQDRIVTNHNGDVQLFYSGNKKLNTTSHGVVVTGIITATSFSGGISGDSVGNVYASSGISTFYDLRVSNNLTVEGTTTTLDTNLIGVDRIEVGANSNSIVGVAITQSGTADILNLYDGSTEVFSVADGGAVSTKSLTATGNINVASGDIIFSHSNHKIQCASSASTLNIQGGASNPGGKIELRGGTSDNNIIFLTSDGSGNSVEKFRIHNNGNVGVNSTSPTSKLDVVGNVKISNVPSGYTSGALKINTDFSNYGHIQVRDKNQYQTAALNVENENDGTDETCYIYRAVDLASSAWANARMGAKSHSFQTSADTLGQNRRLLIDTDGIRVDGRVQGSHQVSGIRVNTDILNYGVVSARDGSNADQSNQIACFQAENGGTGNDETNIVTRSVNRNSTQWANAKYAAKSHIWTTGGSVDANIRVLIDSSGKVGIGTATPTGILEIDAASTTEMIMLDVSGTNFAKIGHNSSSGVAVLDIRSEGHTRFLTGGNNEAVRITAAEDVGIGYDSPPCKLAIRDTAEFTAYAGITPNSSNILLQLWNNPPNETANDHASMQFAVNGGSHNRVNTISAVAESAGNRKMAFTFCTDDAGNRTEKMRITGDGAISFDQGTTAAVTPSQATATSVGHQSMSGGSSWFNHNNGTDYFGVDGDWKLANGTTYGKIVARNTQGAISNAEQAGHTWFMVCKTVAGTLGNSDWVVEPVAGWKMAWPTSLSGGATATFYMRDAVESFGSPTIPASGDYYIGWFYSVSQDMGTNGGAYYVDATTGGKIYYYSSEGDLSNPHQRIPRQGDSWDASMTGEKIHFRFETLPKADLTGTVFASPLLVDPVMQGVPLIDGLPMAGGQLVKDVQWATNVSSVEFMNADFVNCNYLVTYSINGGDGSGQTTGWYQTRLQFCDHDGIYKTGTNDYISHTEWLESDDSSPTINGGYNGYQRSIWLTGNGANYDHEGYVWIIPSNFRHNRNANISVGWANGTTHTSLTHPRIFVRGHSFLSSGVDNAHYKEEGGGTYRGSNDIFTLSGFRLYGSANSNYHTPASNGSSNGYVRIWRFKSGFEAREVS